MSISVSTPSVMVGCLVGKKNPTYGDTETKSNSGEYQLRSRLSFKSGCTSGYLNFVTEVRSVRQGTLDWGLMTN